MGALETIGLALLLAAQAGYGSEGKPCYPNATCDQGLRCEQSQCVVDDPWAEVGGLGQNCFPNQTCRDGLTCQAGLCTVTPAGIDDAAQPTPAPSAPSAPTNDDPPPTAATAAGEDRPPEAQPETPSVTSDEGTTTSSSTSARKVTRTTTAHCQKSQPDGGISWSACGGAAGVACGTAAVCSGCGVATVGAALLPVGGMIALASGVPPLAALPLSAGMYCGTVVGVGAMACGFPASAGAGLSTAGLARWLVDYDFNDFLFFMAALLPATLAGISLMVGAVVLGLSTVALLPFLLGAMPVLLPVQMLAYYGVWSLVALAVGTGTMTMTIPALITLIEALLSEEAPDPEEGTASIEIKERLDESSSEAEQRDEVDGEGKARDQGEFMTTPGNDEDVRAMRCGPPRAPPVAMTAAAPMRY